MRFLLLLLSAMALATVSGCGGGSGVPKRIFPPEARIQELRLTDDGALISLRVQSFSTVPSELESLRLRLAIAGRPSAEFDARPGKTLLPGSSEIIDVAVPLSSTDRNLILALIAERRALRYRLDGTLTVDPPGRPYDIDYSSALSPVPGLNGVMR